MFSARLLDGSQEGPALRLRHSPAHSSTWNTLRQSLVSCTELTRGVSFLPNRCFSTILSCFLVFVLRLWLVGRPASTGSGSAWSCACRGGGEQDTALRCLRCHRLQMKTWVQRRPQAGLDHRHAHHVPTHQEACAVHSCFHAVTAELRSQDRDRTHCLALYKEGLPTPGLGAGTAGAELGCPSCAVSAEPAPAPANHQQTATAGARPV